MCGLLAAFLPGYLTKRNLKQLGYDKTTIQNILDRKSTRLNSSHRL